MPNLTHAITALVAALAVVAGSSGASAEVLCFGTSITFQSPPTAYYGYSDQPAEPDASGTSIAVVSTTITNTPTADCTGSITTTTVSKTYLEGPGASDYSTHDSTTTTCEATGTAVCP